MVNAKVNDAAGRLASMRSVDQNPNPPIPINQAIPNFPGTPDAVIHMTGILRFLFFFRLAELPNVLRSAPMSQYPHSS
jgi:hypothetical protein